MTNGTTYYYRTCAYDNAGNVSMGATASATPQISDTTPPTGSISINNGATYTNSTSVILSISASDPSGVSQMCVSNTTLCSSWETYTTSKSWTLTSGDGTKIVYILFKDNIGNANSSPYSDSIILDTTPPTPGTIFNLTASNGQCSLNWDSASDNGSGMHSTQAYEVRYQAGSDPGSCIGGAQAYIGTGLSYLHPGLTNGTTYYYRLCYKDSVGNESQFSGNPKTCTPQTGIESNCFDGIDNDNDSKIDCADSDCDEKADGSCDTGQLGICADGTYACSEGSKVCLQKNQPQQEGPPGNATCSDGLDNDCDGETDSDDPDCADFTKTGIFHDGYWYLDLNGNHKWDTEDERYKFGRLGDIPITGDWNNDGYTEIGIFRSGYFYLDSNGNGKWDSGVDTKYKFGSSTDIPVKGGWNGDGYTEIGIFRNGYWYLDINRNYKWDTGDNRYKFGSSTDIPVTGDWNGDGMTEIGIFRNGYWYLDYDGNGKWDSGVDKKYKFGSSGDIPVTGKW
ncbi:MAG: hypothetical protein QXQ02_03430 [Halobacteria archaeon]